MFEHYREEPWGVVDHVKNAISNIIVSGAIGAGAYAVLPAFGISTIGALAGAKIGAVLGGVFAGVESVIKLHSDWKSK